MRTESLELRLRAFRLPSFLAHYAPLAEQAAQGGWGHVQYLDELASLEATERGDRRIARLLKDAKLPREKTLATLDLGRSRPPCARPLGAWPEGSSSKARTTCASSAIPASERRTSWWRSTQLVRAGHAVLFTAVSELVEKLLQAKRDLRLSRELSASTASRAWRSTTSATCSRTAPRWRCSLPSSPSATSAGA